MIGASTYGGADWWYETYGRPQQQRAAAEGASLAANYSRLAEQARQSNIAREKEIRGIYTDILNSIAGDSSSLRKAGLADIAREEKRLVGTETQNLISSGLYGTTTAASIPTRVATEYTQPSRMKLEDLISQRKREAQLGLAGFVERIEEPYPDYNALIQAMAAQGTR